MKASPNVLERNSNFELIRIVAMTFILCGHIIHHGLKGQMYAHDFFAAFFVTGVNLFVLISGYFKIHLKWQSLLNILTTVIFYSVISSVAYYIKTKDPISTSYIIKTFLPMSRGLYWFVMEYMMLMLISPVINLFLSKANHRTYIFFLVVLIYFNCVSGFLFNNSINFSGYTLSHMVLIYVVGDAIKRYNIYEKTNNGRLILIYLVSTMLIVSLAFIIPYIPFNQLMLKAKLLSYNNPAVLIASVALFCIFVKLQIKSKAINTIAKYVFPMYLIQDSDPLGSYLYNLLYKYIIINDSGLMQDIIYCLCYLLIIALSVVVLENIRKRILDKPIKHISIYLEKKISISH